MSTLSSWLWGTSQVDDAIDKATSELLPAGGEDIALNLEICDQIRSKSAPAKDAMRALKRRLGHKNPNVQLLTLSLTDICIKNGGDHFLVEIASREFMDNLISILKIPALNIDVKNTILRLVQNWSVAFEGKPALNYVSQVYKTLVNEGYKFPPQDPALANSAMVDTQTAPEWIDSEVCLRCRTPFSFTNRRHHCRNCGQVFDHQCSAKSLPLPHFGITEPVRVCDGCHTKLMKRNDKLDNKPQRHSSLQSTTRHRSGRELADAELQRAIQLSLQEVSSSSAVNGHARPGYTPYQPPESWQYSEPPLVERSTRPKSAPQSRSLHQEEEEDPDLKAAIEASLREANAPKPSAPIVVETPRSERSFAFPYSSSPSAAGSYPPGVLPPHPSASQRDKYELNPLEEDAILTFTQTVDQVAQGTSGGRYPPGMNEMYEKANGVRPKLALSLDDAGRKEQMLADMNDKLSQAVKLYDKILTEQISQPRWRTASTPAVYHAQQPQWSYQSQPQQQYQQPLAEPPRTIHSPPSVSPSVGYAVGQDWRERELQTPRPDSSRWIQQQGYHPVEQQQQGYQSTNRPQQQQQQQYAPPPPPQQQQQSQQSHYYQTPQTPVLTPSAPPSTSPQINYAAPKAPPLPHASPPTSSLSNALSYSPGSQQQFVPQPGGLTRHNTIASSAAPSSYSTVPSPPLQQQHGLGRSNTVSHAPRQPPLQARSSYQRQPTVVASPPPPPTMLPQFPIAPTSAPQTFSLYGPSGLSQTPVPEERKEALLIEL